MKCPIVHEDVEEGQGEVCKGELGRVSQAEGTRCAKARGLKAPLEFRERPMIQHRGMFCGKVMKAECRSELEVWKVECRISTSSWGSPGGLRGGGGT